MKNPFRFGMFSPHFSENKRAFAFHGEKAKGLQPESPKIHKVFTCLEIRAIPT
ncbi:MAG TPA: hypothetical protein IAC39_03950 [Candidatus Faeciplasma pullistercoris]|uniref:Uncharacterized protein n=1 Tax=Candidatus Faeciplasma pullistercoris TaxID=2840800 RepID=A0A9D1GU91_9FIRM|nr:hypothetical protein [Candidatus Faeciplasma pullistercoris]